jgi:hypothetical protein
MPVNAVIQNGKTVGYRWGDAGEIYTIAQYGNDLAKYKALAQGSAITNSMMQKGQVPQ